MLYEVITNADLLLAVGEGCAQGEGLVHSRSLATEGFFLFDQDHGVAQGGCVQGSLHAGETTTQDQYGLESYNFV